MGPASANLHTFGLMHCGKSTHRVERLDRDARHEPCSTRSRATSSTKPAPTAAPRGPCTSTKCGRAAPPLQGSDWVVLRRGSPFRDRSSVCRAPGNGTHAAVELPTVLPIRILQLSPAAQHLNANKCNSIESV